MKSALTAHVRVRRITIRHALLALISLNEGGPRTIRAAGLAETRVYRKMQPGGFRYSFTVHSTMRANALGVVRATRANTLTPRNQRQSREIEPSVNQKKT